MPIDNYKEERPWGSFTVVSDGQDFKVKILEVLPGKRLSLQSHQKREENWVVAEGSAWVQLDDEYFSLEKGEHIFIPKTCKHRLENKSEQILKIVETQTGEYFGEDDIVRYADDYNRA